ncbi:MAG TPA: response regulator [Opitutaceae bacterium]|nr:response regulator [Opitutaceae bacterium]
MKSDQAAKPDVLVIDDEIQIRRLLRATLEGAGYAMREAATGQLGLSEIAFRRPDAVVLDLGLPDLSGLDVLKRVREWTEVPVLILSVLGQEENKVAALDAGADDYLTKPFGGAEFLARIRVMLRRNKADDGLTVVKFGDIEIDLARRVVGKAGDEVALTAKEYALLRLLVLHRGKVLTHRQLLREVWGPQAEEQTHYLRVYVDRLRRKLEDDPTRPKHLLTALGVGYRLVAE